MGKDARYALRWMLKRPGFTLVAVATLALGIGANTAIFSVVRGVLLEPLPFHEPDRLVLVWETDRHNGTLREGTSVPDFYDFREQSTSFTAMASSRTLSMNLVAETGRPERLSAAAVSASLLPMLGIEPVEGRTFTAEDDRSGAAPVAILAHGAWRRLFGGSTEVVGETLTLEGRSYEVVGVLPEGVVYPAEVDLYVPLEPTIDDFRAFRGAHVLITLGRLATGVDLVHAQTEMDTVATRLEEAYPEDNAARGVFLEPLHEAAVGEVRGALLVLLGAVGLVLLIACANVANLMLARAAQRAREIEVRASLGAGRWRLVRQLLTESLLLALLGGGAGLLLAFWATDALLAMVPGGLPRVDSVRIDGGVLAFTLAVSVGAGILFGLVPAFQSSRPPLAAAGRGASAGVSQRRLRGLLVVAEVALAVVLLVAAGLLIKSFWRLVEVDPGFEVANLLTMTITLPDTRYPPPPRESYDDWPRAVAFYDQLLERMTAAPGVISAALAMNDPLSAGWTTRMTVDGRTLSPGDELEEVRLRAVSRGYFRTAGLKLLAGRGFEPTDGRGSPRVLVVNEALAKKFFPGEDPVGRSVTFWGKSRQVVGVVSNVRFRGLDNAAAPAMYPLLDQLPMGQLRLVARTEGDSTAAVAPLREAVWSVDPELAVFNVGTLEEVLRGSLAGPRFHMTLLVLFGSLALALAGIGVYGVMAYGVTERTREIGIRLALGARAAEVLRLVVRQGMALAAAATALGLLLALAAGRLLESLLFEVSAADPWVFAAGAGVLAAVAFLACWVPARRASRVDPQVALRWE